MRYIKHDYVRINSKNSKYHDYNGVVLGTISRPQQDTLYIIAVEIAEGVVRHIEVHEDSLVYCGHIF